MSSSWWIGVVDCITTHAIIISTIEQDMPVPSKLQDRDINFTTKQFSSNYSKLYSSQPEEGTWSKRKQRWWPILEDLASALSFLARGSDENARNLPSRGWVRGYRGPAELPWSLEDRYIASEQCRMEITLETHLEELSSRLLDGEEAIPHIVFHRHLTEDWNWDRRDVLIVYTRVAGQ
jgi:hypothetical protein